MRGQRHGIAHLYELLFISSLPCSHSVVPVHPPSTSTSTSFGNAKKRPVLFGNAKKRPVLFGNAKKRPVLPSLLRGIGAGGGGVEEAEFKGKAVSGERCDTDKE
jgi:hypothetical protein